MAGTKGAAPDVDLKAQGVPRPLAIGGTLLIVCLVLNYTSRSSPAEVVADALGSEEDEAVPATLATYMWMLLNGVWRLFQLLCTLAVILLGVLVVRQRSILYVPTPPGMQRSPGDNYPEMFRTPRHWNLAYEDVAIMTEDGVRIHAWLVYHTGLQNTDPAPYTIMFFHGNAGNIGHRLENIRDMHSRLRVNVLIVDYRGYGDSEDGSGPCEEGFLKDAEATYRWLIERTRSPPPGEKARLSADRVLIFGRSIGGAVGVRLMAHLLLQQQRGVPDALPMPAGIVLENTFTSLREMAVQIFPFLSFLRPLLRKPLVRDEWKSLESLEFLAQNHRDWSCLLLSGLQDQLVPPQQMRQIHEVLKRNRPKVLKFITIADGGHNDTPAKGGTQYWEFFQKFVSLVQASEAGVSRPAPQDGPNAPQAPTEFPEVRQQTMQ